MNDDWYHAWHYQQDALPFIVHTDDDGIELHIVTGTWSQYGPDTEQSVAVNWCIIDPDGKPGPTTTTNSIRIDGQTIGDLNAQQPPSRKGARVPYRPYTILSSNLGTDGYYETVIPIPHPPTEIHYTIQAT